jgi:DNA-binding response OmpR family regulator/Tfp pilus assembly protein PilZ
MGKATIQQLVERWFGYRMEQEKRSRTLLVAPPGEERHRLVAALNAAGLVVATAPNASDAIEILETDVRMSGEAMAVDPDAPEGEETQPVELLRGPKDLVIAFFELTDLDGLDLMRFISSRPYEPALMLITHSPDPWEAALAISLGVDSYVDGNTTEPEDIAHQAAIHWHTAVMRRVQGQMIADLRATLEQTVPQGNVQLARDLDKRISASAQSLKTPDTVLVVESDYTVREPLLAALDEMGVNVESAVGCEDTLALLRDTAPDVVVVDPSEADMDVNLFYEQAKRVAPGVEVIVVTHPTSLEQAQNALGAGVADFIRKPLGDATQAAQRVRAVLRWKRQRCAAELLLTDLYRLASEKLSRTEPSGPAADMTERLFAGILPARPGEGKGGGGTPLELRTGDYEVVSDELPARGSPPRKRSTTLELGSGDYEVIRQDESLVDNRCSLPDLAVLDYIDNIVWSDRPASRPPPLPAEAPGKGAEPPPIPVGPSGGRRRLPRTERSFVVTFGPADSPRTSLGFLKDVSLGGMFISADPPASTGEEIQLTVQVPTDTGMRRIGCQGRVVWNTLEDNDKLEIHGPGFGLEFTVLPAEGSELLRKVMAGEI